MLPSVLSVLLIGIVLILLESMATGAEIKDVEKKSTRSRSSSSSSTSAARGSRGRGEQTRRQDQNLPYYWMCPEVRCPTISSQCQTVEYIVYEYQYEVRGKGIVNVRCQSCEYCLDMPQEFLTRRALHRYGNRMDRRSQINTAICPACPSVPETCIDVRPAMVSVAAGRGGRTRTMTTTTCRQCPACFDKTIIAISSAA